MNTEREPMSICYIIYEVFLLRTEENSHVHQEAIGKLNYLRVGMYR